MTTLKRAVPAAFAAVFAVLSGGLGAAKAGATAGLKPLSPWDAQIYASAFDAAGRGDFAAARAEMERAGDKSLEGRVELHRLLRAEKGVQFGELSAWLERHSDTPGAERIYAMAKQRQPVGAPEPKAPSFAASRNWADLQAGVLTPGSRVADRGQPARELFYSGDIKGAHDKAVALGERWIAGLAAFRLKNYAEAQRRFEAVARDKSESEWLRAGAGYWAARSAIADGAPELAPDFLRLAAAHPKTFYGLIAERQLGLDPVVQPPAEANDPIGAQILRVAYAEEDGLGRLIRADDRAHRAAALAQIGLIGEASVELRAALAASKTEQERRGWVALAAALGAPLAALQVDPLDDGEYPVPALNPRGGFTLDPALVYAIVRQESRFNPNAQSHVGATGLMQLMPATAADISGDSRLKSDASPLRDPGVNLRLGQDYFAWLLERAEVDDCILRAVASYNGGSGTVLRTSRSLGDDSDALMLIESLPYRETRDYVERVMAGYWIYRQMFGEELRSLDAVASGARTVDARLDRAHHARNDAASSMSLRASR